LCPIDRSVPYQPRAHALRCPIDRSLDGERPARGPVVSFLPFQG
jgi:hypothetical protein